MPTISPSPVAAREDRRPRSRAIATVVDAIGRIQWEHVAPLGAALAMTAFVVHLVFRRLAYPYDLDWLIGSILDHVERVRNGQPLYTAPTPEWVPFMYPPLFYWLSALTTRIVPLPIGPRVLSIGCSLVQAWCIWRLARRHGATRPWAAIGVGLFFAAFGYTGFWYDVERSDPLFMALMMAGAVVICETTSVGGAAVAGVIVGAGFLAKQPAIFFAAGGLIALLLRRETGRAIAFGAAVVVVVGVATLWLHRATDGWFSYYVIQMPLAHGLERGHVAQFFVHDLAQAFVLTIASGALLLAVARGLEADAVLACMLASGFVASATSRMHHGGWSNVLLFWSVFAMAAVAIVGSRIDAALSRSAVGRAGVGAVVTLQMALWSFDPHAMHPPSYMRGLTERFDAGVRALEASSGEVLLLGRGHVTAPRHFHLVALADVLRADGRLPPAISRALAEHRYGAIVVGDPGELRMIESPELDQQLYRAVAANYYVAERLDDQPLPVEQFAWQATFVLRPRARNLDAGDVALLDRHHHLEVMVAVSRLRSKQMRIATPADQPTVEEAVNAMIAQPAIH